MKNLKKVLALGLALVMMLGMMSIAAAADDTKMVASDLTDWADVENKDAVSLCVDLGIINGIPQADGSVAFKPADSIDRASWSQMVYFAMTNDTDAKAYIPSTPVFTDVKGTWAEGQISYLSTVGVISGQGDGTYNPTGNITVAAGAVTLITALGYDREKQGYLNNPMWDTMVMKDARKFGIMDGVSARGTDTLTRDQAAQMIYNTLNTPMVEADQDRDNGEWYTKGYTPLEPLGYDTFGIIKVTGKVGSVESDGTANFVPNTMSPNVSSSSVSKKIQASPSQVGEKVVFYIKGTGSFNTDGECTKVNTFDSVVSSTVAKGGELPVATITGGIDLNDAYNSTSDDYIGDKATKIVTDPDTEVATTVDDVEYYVNGSKAKSEGVAYGLEDANEYTKKAGVVTEFYTDNDGKIKVVKIYNYSVSEVTGAIETRTSSNTLQVKVPGVVGTWTDAAKVEGYEALEEGDVALWYKDASGSEITVIEKAEKITGKVTAANSNKQITVNGSKYKMSGLVETVNEEGDFSQWKDRETEFDFFLDKNGTICYAVVVDEGIDKSKVALVLGSKWVTAGTMEASEYLQAKLLFVDGTTEIVTVSKLDGKTVKATASDEAKEIAGADAATALANAAVETPEDATDGSVPAFYRYKVADGKYQLTTMNDNEDEGWGAINVVTSADDPDIKISQKTAFAAQGETTKASANNNTLFLVAKGSDPTYYTYTGFSNVPKMTASKMIAIGASDASVARYVYLEADLYDGEVPDGYVYVRNKNWEEDADNDGYYLWNIVDANGDEDTISVEGKPNAETNVGKFYKIDQMGEDGTVVLSEDAITSVGSVVGMGSGVVSAKNGEAEAQSWSYDSATVFVVIELAEDYGDNGTDSETASYSSCGTFNPENFYSAKDVNTDATAKTTYKSVVMYTPDDPGETANYIYIVRTAW